MVPPITDPSLSQVHSLLQAGLTSYKNNMESLAGTRPQPFPSPSIRFLGNSSFSVTIVSAVSQREETHVFCLTRMSSSLLGQVHGAVQVQDDIPIWRLLLRQPVFYLVFTFRTGLSKALILAPSLSWLPTPCGVGQTLSPPLCGPHVLPAGAKGFLKAGLVSS